LFVSWEEIAQDIFDMSKEPLKQLETMFHPKI
jgi:hypothetical protein